MSELPLNQVLCGDCTEVMRGFPSNSVDLVVTDPPYGLNFMGKDWDKTLPPKEAFEQIIRVLKPGAIAFVNSSPRQDLFARMVLLLESVGFKTDVSFLDWIYKTGFPKAYDVSKGIDKKLGLERDVVGRSPHYSSGRKRTWGDGTKYGTQKGTDEETDWVTEPASELSKKWEGWKSQTGLKPAHEPILMVYKPRSEKTIVDNVLKWGTGAINVDSCRIPFQNKEDKDIYGEAQEGTSKTHSYGWSKSDNLVKRGGGNQQGRFPANLLVSDKAIDTGEHSKSGTIEPHHRINAQKTGEIYGKYINLPAEAQTTYGDVGDQSRYFDLDAWAKHHGFLDVPKPDKSERDFGLKGKKKVPKSKLNLSDGSKDMRFDGIIPTPRRNVHPTVKPIKLMAYLIELGCPPNGIVLDPFVGSGTTCIAAKQLVRKYIGIEINEEYATIARARINAHPVPIDWFAVPPKPRTS